ncbi:unnamed protein product [Caenorhabditis brenneri]
MRKGPYLPRCKNDHVKLRFMIGGDTQSFTVSRQFLSDASPFFRKWLKDKRREDLYFEDIDKHDLKLLLDVQAGEARINATNIGMLSLESERYQMMDVVKKCRQYRSSLELY